MPGKPKALTAKVHAVLELWYVRRIGDKETATVASYDELERHEAEADFQGLCRQAQTEIGTDVELKTEGMNLISGLVDRIVVELISQAVGEWASPSISVMREVVLDDSKLSPKAKAIRDGLLMAPVGQRAKVFGEALASLGKGMA